MFLADEIVCVFDASLMVAKPLAHSKIMHKLCFVSAWLFAPEYRV
jgi:hypothetical protein